MTLTRIPLLLMLFVPAAACVVDGPSPGADADRGPIGKADRSGSCLDDLGDDLCGGQSDGLCWCDDLCHDFGDCCADKVEVCDGGVCPETCGDYCSMAADCELPADCENPGCGCPVVDCEPEPVCPETCGDYCSMAADCELPAGCENPGCGCPVVDCEPEPACPETCGDYCSMAADCELPAGCENPGCGCPVVVC